MKCGLVGNLINRMRALVQQSSGDHKLALGGQLAYFIKGQRTAATELFSSGSDEVADWQWGD